MVKKEKRRSMNLQFYAKNVELDADVKKYAKKKFLKALKYCKKLTEVKIEFEADSHHAKGEETKKVILTAHAPREMIRVEEYGSDFKEAIDLLVPKIRKQAKAYKERQITMLKKNGRAFKTVMHSVAEKIFPWVGEEQCIPANDIVKRKEFAIVKPIDENEAIQEMNKLGHDFYAFIDSKTNKNAILYKRKSGKYGLIYVSDK